MQLFKTLSWSSPTARRKEKKKMSARVPPRNQKSASGNSRGGLEGRQHGKTKTTGR